MRNKRGEVSWLTIMLVIALIALVLIVVFFFTTGRSFSDVISPFTSGSNIDAVRNACAVACSSQSASDFCESDKTVKFGETRSTLDEDGNVVEADSTIATCYELSTDDRYSASVASCSSLC